MGINANQPAYPIQPTFNSIGSICNERYKFEGLTKREYFAGLAMQGLLSCEHIGASGYPSDQVAKRATDYADALLTQLNKTP